MENWSQRVVIFHSISVGAIEAQCSDLWCSTVSPHCRCEKIFYSLSWPPAELMGMWLQSLTWQTSAQTGVHSLLIFKSCSVRCLLFRIKQHFITREGRCHGNAANMYFFHNKSLHPVTHTNAFSRSPDLNAAISPQRRLMRSWALCARSIGWTSPAPKWAAQLVLPWWRTLFKSESPACYWRNRVMPKLRPTSLVTLIHLAVTRSATLDAVTLERLSDMTSCYSISTNFSRSSWVRHV